jgi:hypothetical protein
MAINIRVLAYTFPAICIVMGVILLIAGQQMNSPELRTWGGNLIIIGAVLQALYLILRYGRQYLE